MVDGKLHSSHPMDGSRHDRNSSRCDPSELLNDNVEEVCGFCIRSSGDGDVSRSDQGYGTLQNHAHEDGFWQHCGCHSGVL